jgi:hypothetical protein
MDILQMARMVATKTALSARVDALTDADEKSTPSAPTIGLENRAKLEARLRSLEEESDATGVRRFAAGPNQQKRVKPGPAMPTYNPAADAVGLVSTQREPMESAVKAALDVKEEKRRAKEERRAKRRAEKEKDKGATEPAVEGEADAMEVDETKGEYEETKRKRRKSEFELTTAVTDGASPMVRGVLYPPIGLTYSLVSGRHRDRGGAQSSTEAGKKSGEGSQSSQDRRGRGILVEIEKEEKVRGIEVRPHIGYSSCSSLYHFLLCMCISTSLVYASVLSQTVRVRLRLSSYELRPKCMRENQQDQVAFDTDLMINTGTANFSAKGTKDIDGG